ncbi:THAP-type domain-containing protein [Sergentomyia squamirostris]
MSKRCCAEMCFNSQMNNKSGNIAYFGIPKYEEYAAKWLTAAGRDDLLSTKPLKQLIKYFICAEHFEDNCFVSGSQRMVLRKQMHPLEIPIPTIFKSNIEKFVSKYAPLNIDSTPVQTQSRRRKRSRQRHDELPEEKANDESITIYNLEVETHKIDERDSESIEIYAFESSIEGLDDPEEHEVQSDVKEEAQLEEIHILDPMLWHNYTHSCRLCSKSHSSMKLLPIFQDAKITEMLSMILPNIIIENDGLPQNACEECLEKVKLCSGIINSFVEAQENFID